MVITIPVEFAHCFRCSFESIKLKVETLLNNNLPNEDAWLASRDKMLLPTLRRLSALDTSCSMPLVWTDLSKPLPQCPPGTLKFQGERHRIQSLMRIRYWEMCRMARLDYERHRDNFNKTTYGDSIFHAFSALGDSIMSLIMLQFKPEIEPEQGGLSLSSPLLDQDNAAGVWNQIKLIRNKDSMAQIVYHVAASSTSCKRLNSQQWKEYIHTMSQCGALEYGLMLAENMNGKQKNGLKRLASLIRVEIDRQQHMRLILAASFMDKNSTLHILGPDMLRLVAIHLHVEEPVLWEDVLSPHIDHDILVPITQKNVNSSLAQCPCN